MRVESLIYPSLALVQSNALLPVGKLKDKHSELKLV